MAEKSTTQYVDKSSNEDNTVCDVQPGRASVGRRRKSVALNIVENPLQVSYTNIWPMASSRGISSIEPDSLSHLQRTTPEQTVLDARTFCESNGMAEHADMFGRAALVAREQQEFESVSSLTKEERAVLVYEKDHKWHGPRTLWYSISLCAIGAATQGWDQTGSNGANLSFPEEFGIAGKGKDEWIVGLINAIIYLTAGLM